MGEEARICADSVLKLDKLAVLQNEIASKWDEPAFSRR
jgi:hypothetical protein